ncbi:MAG: MFS transporter [Acidimicrobiales bacterium]
MSVVHPWSLPQDTAPRAARRRPSHATPDRATVVRGTPRRAPRHFGAGRFGFVWGAGAISSIGDGLTLVAFPLLATRVTANPALIAGVAVATRLPWLLLSRPAGALADRLDRRRLLTVVELSRMAVLVVLGGLIASHHATLPAIYLASFALGSLQILFVGATQAVIPELVPDSRLAQANGRLYAAQMGGEQFIGPAIGGLAFAAFASLPVLADGASFAVSALLLVLALPRRQPAVRLASASMATDIGEGLRWFAHHRILRLVSGLVAVFAFCQSLGLAILVVYGLKVLRLSGTGFGVFVAIGAIGNLVGALAAARVVKAVGTGRVLVGAGLLAGVCFLVIGRTASQPVALAALIGEAVAVGVGNVASVALRQSLIPRALAGRVNIVMRTCTYGAITVGAVVGGIIAATNGPSLPFAVGGAVQLAGTVALGIPLARRLARDATLTIDLLDDETIDLDIDPWVSNTPDVVLATSEVA